MFAQRIVIFGPHEPDLSNRKVSFVPSEQFPRIKVMAEFAALQKNHYVAICNGDILLDPKILRIENRMRFSNYRCASSRRWHFDPLKPMSEALETADLGSDRGRDVFVARWDVWTRIAAETPDRLRIGHGTWDAFMTDKFREHWNDKFIDFTAFRMVHHPHHGDRRRPHELEVIAQ